MPTDCVIIITTGHTDLQFVDSKGVLHELKKDHNLHSELLTRLADVVFVDFESVQQPNDQSRGERKPTFTAWPDGEIKLTCPKLDPILKEVTGSPGITVRGAVVFQTRRDPSSRDVPGEPIAAGPLIARRIGNVLGLNVFDDPWDPAQPFQPGRSQWVNVLIGAEDLTGPTDRDHPLSRIAADRLDRAIRQLRLAIPGSRALVSTMGGPGPFKDVTEASVRLHFDSAWDPADVPVGARQMVKAGRSAVNALRIREQASQLVGTGDFRGARAVGNPLKDDPPFGWLQEIEAIADWLDGRDVTLPRALGSIPGNKALRAAFRVESALQAGRVPQAIVATGTFHDALFFEALAEWCSGGVQCEVDFERQELKPANDPGLIRELCAQLSTNRGRTGAACLSDPFPPRPGWYRYDHGRKCSPHWFRILKRTSCEELAKIYNKKRSLPGSESDAALAPRDLRDYVAHSKINSTWLKNAKAVLLDSGLWKSKKRELSLLASPLVIAALANFNVQAPRDLYLQMVNGGVSILQQQRLL